MMKYNGLVKGKNMGVTLENNKYTENECVTLNRKVYHIYKSRNCSTLQDLALGILLYSKEAYLIASRSKGLTFLEFGNAIINKRIKSPAYNNLMEYIIYLINNTERCKYIRSLPVETKRLPALNIDYVKLVSDNIMREYYKSGLSKKDIILHLEDYFIPREMLDYYISQAKKDTITADFIKERKLTVYRDIEDFANSIYKANRSEYYRILNSDSRARFRHLVINDFQKRYCLTAGEAKEVFYILIRKHRVKGLDIENPLKQAK